MNSREAVEILQKGPATAQKKPPTSNVVSGGGCPLAPSSRLTYLIRTSWAYKGKEYKHYANLYNNGIGRMVWLGAFGPLTDGPAKTNTLDTWWGPDKKTRRAPTHARAPEPRRRPASPSPCAPHTSGTPPRYFLPVCRTAGGVLGRLGPPAPPTSPACVSRCRFSAGLRIWNEHMSVSSTLIIAPALSNSPQ